MREKPSSRALAAVIGPMHTHSGSPLHNWRKCWAAEEDMAKNYRQLPHKSTPFLTMEKPWLQSLYMAPNWYWVRTNEIFIAQH